MLLLSRLQRRPTNLPHRPSNLPHRPSNMQHRPSRVQVGNSMDLLPGEPWLTTKLPVAQWPTDVPRWARTAAHGDRRIELGLVGMDADVEAVRRVLSRALLTLSLIHI